MLGFLLVLGGASVSGAAMEKYQVYVQKECSFTRYPSICVQTLMALGGSGHQDLQHMDIMSALVNKTIHETRLATSEFSKFSSQLFEVHEAQPAHDSVKGTWYITHELVTFNNSISLPITLGCLHFETLLLQFINFFCPFLLHK